jgi:hypothetical protein
MRYAATAAPRVGVSWIGALYLIVGGIMLAVALAKMVSV